MTMLLLIIASIVLGAALLTSFWALGNVLVMAVAQQDTRDHMYSNSIIAAVLWAVLYFITHWVSPSGPVVAPHQHAPRPVAAVPPPVAGPDGSCSSQRPERRHGPADEHAA